jgi:PKD repeat protein
MGVFPVRRDLVVAAALLVAGLGAVPTAQADCDPGFEVSVRADVLAGKAPLTVVFKGAVIGESAGDAVLSWDFDDGRVAGDQAFVTHVYSQEGGYLAEFTATNATSGCEASTTVFIQVNADTNETPTAVMTADFGEGDAPVSVIFTSLSEDGDGRIILHEWSFGDGMFGDGQQVIHNYQQNGAYLVRLTVTDDRGGKDFTIRSIQVGQGVSALGVTPEGAQPTPTNTSLFGLPCGATTMLTLSMTLFGMGLMRFAGRRRRR